MQITLRKNKIDPEMIEMYTVQNGLTFLMCAFHKDMLDANEIYEALRYDDYCDVTMEVK